MGAGQGGVRLHPSRVVRLPGAELPDGIGTDGWGDSVLQAVMDAIRHAGLAAQGVATLIHEAKLDVIRIPQLTQSLAQADYAKRLVERFTLANTMKGLVNALVIDKEEEWDRKQLSFAQLPEIMQQYLQIAAGAADIPATRLLGQAPAGLNATGEGDIRNYYDRIAAEQRVTLGPALRRLDEALILSALGHPAAGDPVRMGAAVAARGGEAGRDRQDQGRDQCALRRVRADPAQGAGPGGAQPGRRGRHLSRHRRRPSAGAGEGAETTA